MFIAALLILPPKWGQSKCPSTSEWINTVWCICTMEYPTYSAIKKWTTNTCYNMDECQIYAKYKKSDAKEHIVYDSTYIECLENTTL